MKTYVEQTWGKWDDDVQAERFRKNFKPDDVQIIIIDGHDAGLLSSDITIEQVAVQTGFTDPYYFSSIFKQKTGSTPSGWRRGDALPLT